MAGEVPAQTGNDHPTITPMGAFPTADGWINIAASSPDQWRRFCEAIGRPDWLEKDEWRSAGRRTRVRAEVNAAVAAETRKQPSAHWVDVMEEAGIPCGPIYTVDQAFADPQVKHLGMAAPVTIPGSVRRTWSPRRSTSMASTSRSDGAAPAKPDATDEVLAEVGYSRADIAAMRAAGAI